MARHCPECGVVLPLSGEANCYCEPRNTTGTAKTGPRSDSEPFGALPGFADVERVCEPRQADPRSAP